MAQISFEDLISDGYTFPGTGGSLVIAISGDEGVSSFEISGLNSNIIGFSATEGGSEVEVIEDEPGADYVVQLTGEEDAEITIEVSESPSTTYDSEAFSVYYQTSEDYSQIAIGQDGYTPPPPPWDDGLHKIYRSGQQVMKMYRSGELIYLRLNPAGEEPTPPDYRSMPLTFKIISGGTISWRANSSAYTKEIQYSINDGTWVSITSTTAGVPISLNAGDIVKFKGDGANSTSSSYINRFRDSTIVFEVYGNIMSLIDSTGYATATTAPDHSFRSLFAVQTGLTSVENLVLPATTIGTNVYKQMFSGCTNLILGPAILPAPVLTESCYSSMFNGCTSLTTAPELPATILASQCYISMFQGCKSLATAPELPATTLAERCYEYMFNGCASLNYIKCLARDISASRCTTGWVSNVASTGTFVKNQNMSGWTTGTSGIPSGWTPVDA